MREAITHRPRVDAAAFDAALRRVVDRAVAAPADDSAGARVVSRLAAPAAWRPGLVPLLAASAVVAAAVVLVVSTQDWRPAPARAADVAVHATPTDAAPPEPRGTDRRMIAGPSPAVATSTRRRWRPRVVAVAAARDGDPSAEPAASPGPALDASAGCMYYPAP